MPSCQAVSLIAEATWSDELVELQLWTKLAYLALEAKDHNVVTTATGKALQLAESNSLTKTKATDRYHQFLL